MKGTMTNTRKGTSRKRSAQVLSNCTEKSTADITIQPDTQKKKKNVFQRSVETEWLKFFHYSKPLKAPF